MNNDHKTTIAGAVFAAMAASKIDWTLLMQGDKSQVASLIGAIAVAAFGYFAKGMEK